ncbi:MAG: anaerobic ribonucleoside-triphosphate reductase activating protein [Lachnospiraceae bacterium]|nr:anaerobic ribonucleoside-triphosphate reductase activating protein [Lachnospiraceae bacterium]
MIIRGFNKTTLLDFPGKVASTVFTGGCNFKCVFCQNAGLVLAPDKEPEIPEEEIFEYIHKRKGILEGICITGGEPTLEPGLIPFMERVKKTGIAVKLDTNGYRPEILREIMDKRLADMFAMDIKSDKEGYAKIAGMTDLDISRIELSAKLIMQSGVDYEFRTTAVKGYFDEAAAKNISQWLSGAGKYYIQRFKDGDNVLKSGLSAPDIDTLKRCRDILSETIEKVELRGVD